MKYLVILFFFFSIHSYSTGIMEKVLVCIDEEKYINKDITKSDNQEEELRKYKKGDQVKTIILYVDADRERVSLGIKQLDSD